MSYYSFVLKKGGSTSSTKEQKIELLERKSSSSSDGNTAVVPPVAIKLKILKVGLTANNKFYIDFGEKAPFNFFKCYPVLPDDTLVETNTNIVVDGQEQQYVHPSVWGLCQVIESTIDGCDVGTVFRAMLPIGTNVEFESAKLEKSIDGKQITSLVINRPSTSPAYNSFVPISTASVEHPLSTYVSSTSTVTSTTPTMDEKETLSSLAMVCFPGIITGFCLCHHLQLYNYYGGCDTIVITSGSSKVALAFALCNKYNKTGKKIIAMTSDSNKEFVLATQLYDQVIGYDESIPTNDDNNNNNNEQVIMIDISGQSKCYKSNESKIRKLLVVGNASDTPEKDTTFNNFTILATIKMIGSMMMIFPTWLRNILNTKQELYLVFHTTELLVKEWGTAKYEQSLIDFTNLFCTTAIQDWNLHIRYCDTEQDICTGFQQIVQGTVLPNECIVLDVNKAVEHRR